MVDTARQLLDELMGRNRNLDPTTAKSKKVQWDDPEVSQYFPQSKPKSLLIRFQFCLYYLVKFCPHELFVNTRADLGQCTKLHDDEAKRLFDEARPSARKRSYEDEFLRFSNHMINEVDRKIEKGRQRLLLMNKTTDGAPQVYISKYQEQLNNLNARINKLINEAEEAGVRGDVDQAQDLMTLCDQLKEEKEALVANHSAENGSEKSNEKWNEYTSNEKQMEVCEVCGAFLIVGDAQQRIEDHLSGKQHLGYSRLRKAVEEMYEQRKKEREEEDRQRDQDRRHKMDGGMRGDRRDRGRERGRDDFEDRRRGPGNRGDRDRDRGDRDRERRRDRDRAGPQRDREREREREHRDGRRKFLKIAKLERRL